MRTTNSLGPFFFTSVGSFECDFNIEGLLSNLTFSDVCVQSISGRAIDVTVKTLMSDTMFFVSRKSNFSKGISLFSLQPHFHQIFPLRVFNMRYEMSSVFACLSISTKCSTLDGNHLSFFPVWINYLFANLYLLSNR